MRQRKFQNVLIRLSGDMGQDVNAALASAVRESYLQTTEALRFYGDKVAYYNSAKKNTGDRLAALRQNEQSLTPPERGGHIGSLLRQIEGALNNLDNIVREADHIRQDLSVRAAQLKTFLSGPPRTGGE